MPNNVYVKEWQLLLFVTYHYANAIKQNTSLPLSVSSILVIVIYHNVTTGQRATSDIVSSHPIRSTPFSYLIHDRFRRFLDSIVLGAYPPEMSEIFGSRLPTFSSNDKLNVESSLDFIGINHYISLYAKDC
ncbi:Beta-glucosidase 18 [Platanthera zijinensis]|uniref:Beta-glucosidase 18 n=1 Tax=Platanthera zijinensis TaxID=2320716 RepID=A0AAP0G388_9ASPA